MISCSVNLDIQQSVLTNYCELVSSRSLLEMYAFVYGIILSVFHNIDYLNFSKLW